MAAHGALNYRNRHRNLLRMDPDMPIFRLPILNGAVFVTLATMSLFAPRRDDRR